MKPPMCKVCGFAHWSGNPHYVGEPTKTIEATPVRRVDPAAILTRSIEIKPAAKKPRGRPVAAEPASPRAEYQRELMRKRRASAKVTKP